MPSLRQAAGRLLRRFREAPDRNASESEQAKSAFTRAYLLNLWEDPESRSGPGSTLARTAALREQIPKLFAELGVRSVLDVGCGDFNWFRTLDLGEIGYTGVDVVAELIEDNRKKYGGPRRQFLPLEIATEVPPRADLAFCRDCWVHLPNAQILAALANLRASGTRYLLATTFSDRRENPDIALGDWRPIHLGLPPFSLGSPLRLLSEHRTVEDAAYADKSMGLWEL
ncbi:MAG TPA: class I SAM-dependent methyltransferase [Thermoanaerobaculia bacterium]|nr:class I SAM-dependent methyltransferase [Thermoanaerobaculia bacterium]